jgi:hemoglobin
MQASYNHHWSIFKACTLVEEISERTEITEAMISELMETFYARVREDMLLSPVFAKVKDWDEHMSRLRAFRSSVALMFARYHGQPMQANMPLQIDPQHFDRWLALFEQTAKDVCPSIAAAHFLEKGRRIAGSFEMALATQRRAPTRAAHVTSGFGAHRSLDSRTRTPHQ